jgi:hypothetical protein
VPKKIDPAAELAANLVQALQARRDAGPGSYPLTVRRLVELTDSHAPPEVVAKAVTKPKGFLDRVAVARKKDLDAPAALAEDLDRLAASSLLVEFALNGLGTPPFPGWALSKVTARVDARLKKPFAAALDGWLRTGGLPPDVACTDVKGKPYLYLKRLPPPPPPKPEDVLLAEDLLRMLERQRRGGPDDYPLTLRRLLRLVDESVPESLLKKALGRPPFKTGVVFAVKYSPAVDPPVALAADRERLAGSDLVLEFLLSVARTKRDHAWAVGKLKPKLSADLRPHFEIAAKRRLDAGDLPESVGYLLIGGEPRLFLWEDVRPRRTLHADPRPTPTAAAPDDFAGRFDEAFRRLDRERGGHNFVSLVDLRRAVPADQATFDAGLRQLRLAGRYTLSAAEGRHGLTPEEREAAVAEDGAVLLHVSRKLP